MIKEKLKHIAQEILDLQNTYIDICNASTTIEIKSPTIVDTKTVKKIFGEFKFSEVGAGRIKITDDFQNTNIKLLQVSYHRLWVHKLIFPQLAAAMAEIIALGLDEELDFSHGGGGFCARHMNWKEQNPLSLHSWGIAFDMNPIKYPYGKSNRQYPKVLEIFEKWGFYPGEKFKTPDSMHFQWSHFVI